VRGMKSSTAPQLQATESRRGFTWVDGVVMLALLTRLLERAALAVANRLPEVTLSCDLGCAVQPIEDGPPRTS